MTDIQTMIGMLTPFPDTVPNHERRLYTCGFMREVARKLAELSNKHPEKTSMPSWAKDMGNGMWSGIPPSEPSQNPVKSCEKCEQEDYGKCALHDKDPIPY